MKKLLSNKFILFGLILLNEVAFLVYPIYQLSPIQDAAFVYHFFSHGNPIFVITFCVLTCGIIICDFFIWRAVKMSADNDTIEKKLKQAEAEGAVAYDYYLKSIEIMNETRKYHHDFNNNLQAAYALDCSNPEQANLIFYKLEQSLDLLEENVKEAENGINSAT